MHTKSNHSMKSFEFNTHPKISSGFTTPNGYFDQSTEILLAKMMEESKTPSLWERNKKTYLAAAAVVFLGLSVSLYWNFSTQEMDDPQWTAVAEYVAEHANLSDEAYIDYLNIHDFENLDQMQNDPKVIEELLLENTELENYSLQ